jgi:mRNA interferase MazF
MNKGDIVLVPFPFTDLTGNKYRPALILIESEEEVTVCFITTQMKWCMLPSAFLRSRVLGTT